MKTQDGKLIPPGGLTADERPVLMFDLFSTSPLGFRRVFEDPDEKQKCGADKSLPLKIPRVDRRYELFKRQPSENLQSIRIFYQAP